MVPEISDDEICEFFLSIPKVSNSIAENQRNYIEYPRDINSRIPRGAFIWLHPVDVVTS